MNWREYFAGDGGKGFLATADGTGRVNVAVYARPYIVEDDLFAFGMADRLTFANLRENPYAVYAFNEGGFEGVRLYLEKVREEDKGPVLEEIRKRAGLFSVAGAREELTHAVFFRLIRHLPLVGAG